MKYLKLFAVLFCACLFWGCDDYNYPQQSYPQQRQNNTMRWSQYSQSSLKTMIEFEVLQCLRSEHKYVTRNPKVKSIEVRKTEPFEAEARISFSLKDEKYPDAKVKIKETKDYIYIDSKTQIHTYNYGIKIYRYATDRDFEWSCYTEPLQTKEDLWKFPWEK